MAATPTTLKRAKAVDGDLEGTLGKPVYVSSGHHVSLATAMALVLASCVESRIPEPVRVADRVGRDEAKRLWPT